MRTGNGSIDRGGYPSGQRGLTVNQLETLLRRFESFTAHLTFSIEGGQTRTSGERLEERQALIAQLVERALGKGEVMGSTPIEGSFCRYN